MGFGHNRNNRRNRFRGGGRIRGRRFQQGGHMHAMNQKVQDHKHFYSGNGGSQPTSMAMYQDISDGTYNMIGPDYTTTQGGGHQHPANISPRPGSPYTPHGRRGRRGRKGGRFQPSALGRQRGGRITHKLRRGGRRMGRGGRVRGRRR